ncbi:phage-like protein [Pseudooceanicola nanhaiensis]|jgi:hypothetical protein|uniref:Phage-like protein n=1 Tax=Pseudooceanicola nanhaiensis TaxID=375761 RepID=A0A917SPQ8_9RHOB|nr:hypothetical protein [Pseudooceanicola nanhaiensis]GGL91377.1 phage-like protein [Pseudooceanicola nanhaiensis]
MTDRPILFSGQMVRALLEGRKTQTRRVIKSRGFPPQFCGGRYDDKNDPECWGWEDFDRGEWITLDQWRRWTFVPYAPGDRLWVREAWASIDACTHNDPGSQALVDRGFYRADHPVDCGDVSRWRPSIHMPRWASRLTLIVTDVRVQRVQQISCDDAVAEGVEVNPAGVVLIDGVAHSGKAAFRKLWDSLNGPRGFGWDANPWVAAYTFTVHHRNIDAAAAA